MRIAVLASGGVDSSLALQLLHEQGHQLTAFYIKIWLEDELSFLGDCPWEEDLAYVRATCDKLGVPLEVMSLQKEYWDIVVRYTIAEVKAGRTPNPDVWCNSRIKFGAFLQAIDDSYDAVATGHYAQVRQEEGFAHLYSAPDAVKDQTYFLAALSQEQLKRTMFPIGHLDKAQVRALAEQYQLPSKDRKDSQGICFLGKLKFKDFIAQHVGKQEGQLIELETGNVLGKHEGFWFYTIGQRQGLGLAGGPWYVAAKDPERNTVYISRSYYEGKPRNTLLVTDVHWIGKPVEDKQLQVKLRHGAQKYGCVITHLPENRLSVVLDAHDQGIAPGQYAVFYVGERCVGAGVIAQEPIAL